MIHAYENLVGGDGIAEARWKSVGIRLITGLDTEVDHRLKQSFDFGRGDLRNAVGKYECQPRAGGALRIRCGNGSVIELNMAQETVLRIWTAVEVKRNLIAFDRHGGYDDTIAGGGGLAL